MKCFIQSVLALTSTQNNEVDERRRHAIDDVIGMHACQRKGGGVGAQLFFVPGAHFLFGSASMLSGSGSPARYFVDDIEMRHVRVSKG